MPMQLTQRNRQAKSKVEIDQRFSGVFSDPKFKRQTVVDKRGRATGAKCVMAATASACCKRSRAAWRLRERTDDLRRFYRLPDEDAAGAEARAVAAGCSSRVLKPPPPSCLRMLRFKTTKTATTPAQAT